MMQSCIRTGKRENSYLRSVHQMVVQYQAGLSDTRAKQMYLGKGFRKENLPYIIIIQYNYILIFFCLQIYISSAHKINYSLLILPRRNRDILFLIYPSSS